MSSHSSPDADSRLVLKTPMWCGGTYALLKLPPGLSSVPGGAPIDGTVIIRVPRKANVKRREMWKMTVFLGEWVWGTFKTARLVLYRTFPPRSGVAKHTQSILPLGDYLCHPELLTLLLETLKNLTSSGISTIMGERELTIGNSPVKASDLFPGPPCALCAGVRVLLLGISLFGFKTKTGPLLSPLMGLTPLPNPSIPFLNPATWTPVLTTPLPSAAEGTSSARSNAIRRRTGARKSIETPPPNCLFGVNNSKDKCASCPLRTTSDSDELYFQVKLDRESKQWKTEILLLLRKLA